MQQCRSSDSEPAGRLIAILGTYRRPEVPRSIHLNRHPLNLEKSGKEFTHGMHRQLERPSVHHRPGLGHVLYRPDRQRSRFDDGRRA